MGAMGAQDRRLEAIAAAAAAVLTETEYHKVRTQDIAARVRLDDSGDKRSARGSRSTVWVYNEARSRRVLVALAARHAWNDYLAQTARPPAEAATAPGAPAGGPAETVTEAIGLVAAALLEIARFHRASQFLMRQVGLGIGDIATSEKRAGADAQQDPSWPDSEWGRVASAGFDGLCSAFADYLAPVLSAAGGSVCPLSPTEARTQARALSDLAFRALLSERDGPLDRITSGLAAYWLERDLVRVSGQWVHGLLAAERGVGRGERRAREPRADAAARGILTDVLLESGVLQARCAAVGGSRVLLLAGLTGFPLPEEFGPATSPVAAVGTADAVDLRTLCDAASRLGLALQRFGDLPAATRAHRLSRAVATDGLAPHAPGEVASYTHRSDHNLAEVALDQGRITEAAALCESAYQQRLLLAESGSAAWRRYSLTAELRVRITADRGRPVEAVALAELLVSDRTQRLGGADNASVAAARVALGQALLAAGHPLAAQFHLEAAHRFHEARSAAFGHIVQRDLLHLAEAALALEDPEQAERLLPAEDEVVWIADHVSFRLAATARRLRATALARTGRLDQAEALVGHARVAFPLPRDGRADPVLLALDRCLAEIQWRSGRTEAAAETLTRLLPAENSLDDGAFSVASARTLRRLAVCADSSSDRTGAARRHAELHAAADGSLDPTHPVLLRADLDHARRQLDAGDIDGAGRLVATLLDRRTLAHGRPALEDGYPLLAEARRLAEDIGVPVAETMDHDWGDE